MHDWFAKLNSGKFARLLALKFDEIVCEIKYPLMQPHKYSNRTIKHTMYMYSGPSLIRPSLIRLLGLSGLNILGHML